MILEPTLFAAQCEDKSLGEEIRQENGPTPRASGVTMTLKQTFVDSRGSVLAFSVLTVTLFFSSVHLFYSAGH